MDMAKVLLVEDSAPQAMLFQQYLSQETIELHHAETGQEAISVMSKLTPDLVLLDLRLPDMEGKEVLQWMRDEDISAPVIIVTGHASVDVAVELIKMGANDFLEKPITAQRLRTSVNNLLEQSRLRHLVADFKQVIGRESYHGFVGASLPMQAVYRIIDAAAPSKASIFITGESGTGKEICAEAIHRQSQVANGPFHAINCGAIPKDLMESEIFGHVKGAFTGASSDRKGAATLADGGTLFLDELGEMDVELQTKLLRFVQTGTFQKVGSSRTEKVDVRFVCATNRDPLQAVADGVLREDLYYRLHVVPIQLPPLRDRGEDITVLAEHFLKRYAKEEEKPFQRLNKEVRQRFLSYEWPGNVRQLQNVMRNIVVLHSGTQVTMEQLPPPLNGISQTAPVAPAPSQIPQQRLAEASSSMPKDAPLKPLATVERETIEHAIALCDGNIPKAAALLEVSPSTIYRKKQVWDEQLTN